MLVYRIEHKQEMKDGLDVGLGPYVSTANIFELRSAHNRSDDHPGIRYDVHWSSFHWVGDPSYVCGFDTPQKLFVWFKGWFKTLHEKNFAMCVYRVPNEAVAETYSQKQILFDVTRAERLYRIRLKRWALSEDRILGSGDN